MTNVTYQKAKQVLLSLIQGVDPETGKDLTHDTILNRADVLRSLLVAIAAIDSVTARNARRALLPSNVGKDWTEDEERRLREGFFKKIPLPEMAVSHERTVRAIEARLEKMGLLSQEQRSTDDPFLPKSPNSRGGKK